MPTAEILAHRGSRSPQTCHGAQPMLARLDSCKAPQLGGMTETQTEVLRRTKLSAGVHKVALLRQRKSPGHEVENLGESRISPSSNAAAGLSKPSSPACIRHGIRPAHGQRRLMGGGRHSLSHPRRSPSALVQNSLMTRSSSCARQGHATWQDRMGRRRAF